LGGVAKADGDGDGAGERVVRVIWFSTKLGANFLTMPKELQFCVMFLENQALKTNFMR
jgi:hypothetical protein